MLGSNFQGKFNWDKARKNKNNNQNNVFYRLLIGFFTQSSQSQIWKTNTYSILINGDQTCLVIEPPVSQPSTWISIFYDSTDFERKFLKTKIEKWLSIGSELESPWLVTYSFNRYTIFNLQYDGEF